MAKKTSVSVCRPVMVSLLLLVLAGSALAQDVTLVWDPNSEADFAGYKVYYGTASGVYGAPIVIGAQTTYTIQNLPAGTYFFAVTAYNKAGLESGYSNEVTKTISASPAGFKCDLNSDSQINALDLQIMINSILAAQPPPSGKGDLNGDGRVDALDLQILANVILGTRGCPS